MILDKLHLLEAKSSQRNETTENGSTQSDGPINEALQRRLDELTLLKLKELERLQAHQNQVVSIRWNRTSLLFPLPLCQMYVALVLIVYAKYYQYFFVHLNVHLKWIAQLKAFRRSEGQGKNVGGKKMTLLSHLCLKCFAQGNG